LIELIIYKINQQYRQTARAGFYFRGRRNIRDSRKKERIKTQGLIKIIKKTK
jgi:hypothetical protein